MAPQPSSLRPARIVSAPTLMFLPLTSLLLLPLLLLSYLHRADAQACDIKQREALEDFYNDTQGPSWRNNSNWLKSIPGGCFTSRVGSSEETILVPDHCCWYGVSCCSGETCSTYYQNIPECDCTRGHVTRLSLTWNNLLGTFPMDSLGNLTCGEKGFRKLELHNNNLTGSLPPEISSLNGLWTLGLGYNNFSGELPKEISEIKSLKELDLTANKPGFSGQVPTGLCQGTDDISNLTDIMISHNQFTNKLSIESCNSLVMLDAQNNALSGSLPTLSGYNNMHMLRLGNNQLTGSIPTSIEKAPLMTVFYMPFNRLTGPIPTEVGDFTYLTGLNLIGNMLTGPIPEDIFKNLGSLQTLWLSQNSLDGTISRFINNSRSLADIDLSTNALYGTIPDEMSFFANLGNRVDLRFNFLSCCGVDFNGSTTQESYGSFDRSLPRLPSFLNFSTFLVPVSDTQSKLSNMKCPMLHNNLKNDTVGYLLNFKIDPEYYLYEHCECEQGFHLELQQINMSSIYGNVPTYFCVEDYRSFFARYPWVLALIVLFATLIFLSGLVWYTCLRRGATRPAVVQSWINMQKRLKGEPTGGTISMVVTDIEGYSNLMKEAPELMTSALNIHNNVLRKSRWTNFGYTVEQEGDSFALVFYEAVDAVMFCLQTQQALMRQAWPDGLFKEEGSSKPPVAASKRAAGGSQFLSSIAQFPSVLRKRRSASVDIPGNCPDGGSISAVAELSETFPDRSSRSNAVQEAEEGVEVGGNSTRPNGSPLTPIAVESDPSRKLSKIGGEPATLFCGLRVRMGVTTGPMNKGSQIRGCKVMEKCKVVSDAGAGGQVILDEATFAKVKDRLVELGAVDHNGINYNMLNKNPQSSPWYMCMFWKRASDDCEGIAPVLDMGTYIYSTTKTLPLTLSSTRTFSRIKNFAGHPKVAAAASESNTPTASSKPPSGSMTRRGLSTRARSGRRKTKESEGSKVEEPLHLYQVLPPPLAPRAKVFGNKLALKDEYVCADPPYFSAPATMEAPFGDYIGLGDLAIELPKVTIVYVGVEGGSSYGYKNKKEAKLVHDMIQVVTRNVLRQVPGGYLAELCERTLTYMLCFPSAQSALAWCLMAQECLTYPDWPESAILQWAEERDRFGRLLFRGPRFKMAMCEGTPKSVTPNMMGLPEYRGECVTSASRYMRDGAHGGQIVCEEGTVLTALKALQQLRTDTGVDSSSHSSPIGAPNSPPTTLPAVKEDESKEDDTEGGNKGVTDPSAIILDDAATATTGARIQPSPDSATLSTGGGGDSISNAAKPRHKSLSAAPPITENGSSPASPPDPPPPLLLQPQVTSRVEATRLGMFSFKGVKDHVRLASVTLGPLAARVLPVGQPKGSRCVSESAQPLLSVDVLLCEIMGQYREFWYSSNTQQGIGSLVDGRSAGMSLSARLVRSMTSRDSGIGMSRRRTSSFASGTPVLRDGVGSVVQPVTPNSLALAAAGGSSAALTSPISQELSRLAHRSISGALPSSSQVVLPASILGPAPQLVSIGTADKDVESKV